MALVLVCDRCGTQEGVSECGFDLCPKCAIAVIKKLASNELPGVRDALTTEVGKPPQAVENGRRTHDFEAPIGVMVLTDEAKAQQRRQALSSEHGAKIVYLKLPPLSGALPQKLKHGGEQWLILELAPPNPHGNYFAKVVV